MKKQFIILSVLAICFASCKEEPKKAMEDEASLAIDSIVTEEPIEEVPMDSIAMQKAWEAYMTPGEPHKMMAAEVGSWTNDMSFWMDPNAEPQKATSTGEIKMILGGRYQQAVHKGDMMGMPFEGISTLAYDNATEEYVSTWMDNMGTGIMVLRGKYDAESKSSTLTGTTVDPMTGKEKQVREVYTIVDDNTRKMEMYEATKGGTEHKTMEIIMKRS